MDDELQPSVGSWYTLVDDGRTFVVLAVDEDKGMIEIRYEDGDLDEIEIGEWSDLDLEAAEPPEGWTPADDELDEPELGYEGEEDEWQAPAAGGARARRGKSWEDDEDEEDDYDDDWGEESDDY